MSDLYEIGDLPEALNCLTIAQGRIIRAWGEGVVDQALRELWDESKIWLAYSHRAGGIFFNIEASEIPLPEKRYEIEAVLNEFIGAYVRGDGTIDSESAAIIEGVYSRITKVFEEALYANFAASAIDARSGETERLDPQGVSAVDASRDAPTSSPHPHNTGSPS